jgi:hypothetical protein
MISLNLILYKYLGPNAGFTAVGFTAVGFTAVGFTAVVFTAVNNNQFIGALCLRTNSRSLLIDYCSNYFFFV